MGKTELEGLSKEELIQLILMLQDEIEALRLKFEKNQKPPTSSKNSPQPPSRDQKGNLPAHRRRRRHGMYSIERPFCDLYLQKKGCVIKITYRT
jgi:hypothetical protein